MSDRIFIRDFEPSQSIEGIFAIYNCQLGSTKNGSHFLKCLLGDKTGKTPGRLWNATEQLFATLPENGFVYIEGETQSYQNNLQIIMKSVAPIDPSPHDLLDLLPSTQYNIEDMFTNLSDILATIEHPALLALAKTYLADEQLMADFRRAPAAMSLHHAFLGGLLEHTLSLLGLANVFCPLYPNLNRDVMLVGLFIHDLGKCEELTWETGFGYSEDGQLIGHIARGSLWLEQKAQSCADQGNVISKPLLRVLHHIILSHHGQPEFGALKIPSTPEALAISLLDNMDAKLQMAIVATRQGQGKAVKHSGHFTEKLWALDTRMYKPDPTTL